MLLSNRILEDSRQKNLFSKSDLRELFTLDDDTNDDDKQKNQNALDRLKRNSNLRSQSTSERDTSCLPSNGSVKLFDARNNDSGSHYRRTEAHVNNSTSDIPTEDEYYHMAIYREPTAKQQHTSSESTSSSELNLGANHEDVSNRDKRLLQALFNGEAISQVYDHNFLENNPNKRDESNFQYSLEANMAKRRVEEATRQLHLLSSRVQLKTETTTILRPPNTSSSSLLANLRQRKEESKKILQSNAFSLLQSTVNERTAPCGDISNRNHRSSSDTAASNRSVEEDTEIVIKRKLLEVFGAHDDSVSGLTSQRILNHFQRLNENEISILKSVLKQVAILENGFWKKKPEF
jgi:hypothetical protein